MTAGKPEQADSAQEDAFVARDSQVAGAHFAGRRAEQVAGFLLPHLRLGMHVLDCGCGPGSITVGLARAVRPGMVIGIDINERYIAEAQKLAAQEKVTNVRFTIGSVYALDFPDGTFDAVLAHAVLEHLTEPVQALQQLRRVLKPGGVIGVRDPDYDGVLLAPQRPILLDSLRLYVAFLEHQGGNQRIGKHFRRLLQQAGFGRVEVMAHYRTYATAEAVRKRGDLTAAFLREEETIKGITDLGLADRQTVEAMADAWVEWGRDPDAFMAQPGCTALAWVE